MAITEDRLRQTFSEGGAQEIYQEVKASGDFLGLGISCSNSHVALSVPCAKSVAIQASRFSQLSIVAEP